MVEAEDEHDEARIVAARIGGLLEGGSSAAEIAVFYRTNAQSRVLEDLLVRHGVPYQVIGGPRFYERAEIKDAMAYLNVLDNPSDDVSLRRIINQPRRGIGDASVDRLLGHGGLREPLALGCVGGSGSAPDWAPPRPARCVRSAG